MRSLGGPTATALVGEQVDEPEGGGNRPSETALSNWSHKYMWWAPSHFLQLTLHCFSEHPFLIHRLHRFSFFRTSFLSLRFLAHFPLRWSALLQKRHGSFFWPLLPCWCFLPAWRAEADCFPSYCFHPPSPCCCWDPEPILLSNSILTCANLIVEGRCCWMATMLGSLALARNFLLSLNL